MSTAMIPELFNSAKATARAIERQQKGKRR